MFRLAVVATALAVALVTANPKTEVSLLGKSGLRFTVEDEPGTSYLILKYTINGDKQRTQTVGLTSQDDGKWEHKDKKAAVKPGDEVSYELRSLINGMWVTTHHKAFPNFEIMPRRSVKRAHTLFKDDFNSWDPSHYTQEVSAWGGGNGEFQVYTTEAANTFVRNGVLYLKPTFLVDNPHFTNDQMYHGRMDLNSLYHACTQSSNWGCDRTAVYDILNPVMSGKVTTHAAMRYGRINVRAKIPRGDWLWPAIWMLPRDWSYGGWPRSGEIDIMESRGNTYAGSGGVNHGVNEVSSTLHWGPDAGQNRYYKTHAEKRKNSGDWHDWHTYSLDWYPDRIVTYVDNQEVLRVNTPGEGFWRWGGFGGSSPWHAHNAPFDKPFQLILNNAVGGAFFPDNWQYNSNKPWHGGQHPMRDFWEKRGEWQGSWHGDDAALQIDYVEMLQN